MLYETLKAMSLPALAHQALTVTDPVNSRHTAYDALCSRVNECESHWLAFDQHQRKAITDALALDFSGNYFE